MKQLEHSRQHSAATESVIITERRWADSQVEGGNDKRWLTWSTLNPSRPRAKSDTTPRARIHYLFRTCTTIWENEKQKGLALLFPEVVTDVAFLSHRGIFSGREFFLWVWGLVA